MADLNKKNIFIGIVLIIGAFVCMLGVFYVTFDDQRAKEEEVKTLKEQLVLLNTEKEIGVNNPSLNLAKLIQEAKNIYGEEESARNEGFLWIDREGKTLVVTLGALNGLNVGSRLAIYDDKNKMVGFVRVETPLDIVSYVRPVNKSIGEFEQDYYRVVFQE